MKGLGSILSLSFFTAAALASNVLELTPDNFDAEILKSGKPALVEFFAPWCGHCKSLAPIYEQLADSLASQKDKVIVAKVDADNHRSLGQRFGVQGFPTLKFFDGKSPQPSPYESKRDLESLQDFIAEKTGVKPKVKKELPSSVAVLTDANFDSVVNGDKNVLVEFYAPWCGHCKNLAPIYEKVAKTFADESDVIVAKLDADSPAGKASAQKYGVTGFPTLKWFPKGSTEAEDYGAGRTEPDLVKFINEKAGTKRATGGGLNDLAGRIEEFDEALKKLVKGDSAALEAVTGEVKKLAAKSKDESAAYYVKVLDKLASNADYTEKELKRLEGIVKKGGLTEKKTDELTVRQNILRQFYAAKDAIKDEL